MTAVLFTTEIFLHLQVFYSLYPLPPLVTQWGQTHSWTWSRSSPPSLGIRFWGIAFDLSFLNSSSCWSPPALPSAGCRGSRLVLPQEKDSAHSNPSLQSPCEARTGFHGCSVLHLSHLQFSSCSVSQFDQIFLGLLTILHISSLLSSVSFLLPLTNRILNSLMPPGQISPPALSSCCSKPLINIFSHTPPKASPSSLSHLTSPCSKDHSFTPTLCIPSLKQFLTHNRMLPLTLQIFIFLKSLLWGTPSKSF